MSEHKKRISKNALKTLFEIICEDSFDGKIIKEQLPAARRIAKSKEALWEYIRGELERRCDEHYDLATLSAGWYYNLKKAETSLEKLDAPETSEEAAQERDPIERYVAENLARRRRGGSQVEGEEEIEEEQDTKFTRDQLIQLARQSTVTSNNGNTGKLKTVKNERKSSNDMDTPEAKTKSQENPIDFATPAVDSPFHMKLRVNPTPSRFNSACSTHVSRNNSTMSVTGYDADNEKGLIKRRRKELKTRAEREMEAKMEEEDEENVEKTEEDKNEDEEEEEMNGADENQEMMEMMEEVEDEERGEGGERERIVDNLKGMIEHLNDHILVLRRTGAIDADDMESLADSLENASKSVRDNKDLS